MSPMFSPPTVDDVLRVTPFKEDDVPVWQWRVGNLLMRHFSRLPRGRSVLKIAGTYRTVDNPSQSDIDSATEAYLGGHIYTVTQAVADALAAAGYTTTADVSVPARTLTWGALAGSTWDEFVDNYGTWG